MTSERVTILNKMGAAGEVGVQKLILASTQLLGYSSMNRQNKSTIAVFPDPSPPPAHFAP